MSMYNQSLSESNSHYLNILSDKVSYRKLKQGIKLYFQYYSRADRKLIIRMQNTLLFVAFTSLSFIPVYFFAYKSSLLPLIIGLNIVWGIGLIQSFWSFMQKRYGMETLTITKNAIVISQDIFIGESKITLKRKHLKYRSELHRVRPGISSNAIIGIADFRIIKVSSSPNKQIKQVGLIISSQEFEKINSLL